MGAAHYTPTTVVAKVMWKIFVCRASCWRRPVENCSLVGRASPYTKVVNLDSWAMVLTQQGAVWGWVREHCCF